MADEELPVYVSDLPRVLAQHPDGEEVAQVVAGNLVRMASAYAEALKPALPTPVAPFLEGCHQTDGTWIHGRRDGVHTCPKWVRG